MEHEVEFKELNSELEHVCALANGMSELALREDVTKELTPDGVFANSVLVLNDVDLPSLAGQEGFWDGVKKGATKVYEWIKQLIRTFKDWFNGLSKRKYDDAATRLEKSGIEMEAKIQEFAKSIVIPTAVVNVPKEFSIPASAPIMRRIDAPDVKTIINKFREEMVAQEEAGAFESEINKTYEAIAARIKAHISAINTQFAELKRIDPNGETQGRLHIYKGMDNAFGSIVAIDNWPATGDDTRKLDAMIKALLTDSKIAQSSAARATSEVEKMNEKAKGNPDQEVQSELARAVSVMKIVTEIAARYRDLVITIDSIGYKAAKEIVDDGVRKALKEAMGEISERSAEYIAKAMDDL